MLLAAPSVLNAPICSENAPFASAGAGLESALTAGDGSARGIDLCHETVRHWWNRFGPLFAADIRRQRVSRMKGFRQWRWHLDEMYVKLNGEMVYLWRAVDHEARSSMCCISAGETAPAGDSV